MAKIVQLVENGEKKYLKTHVEAVDGLDEKLESLGSGGDIESHIDNKDNPHSVTAEQVGAYTKGETDSLLTIRDDRLDHIIFVGTKEEYEALPQEEKEKYLMWGVPK